MQCQVCIELGVLATGEFAIFVKSAIEEFVFILQDSLDDVLGTLGRCSHEQKGNREEENFLQGADH